MVMVSILSLGGGGGASKYGVDRYKPPDRVWFLRVRILKLGIIFDHLVSSQVAQARNCS